MSRSYKKVSSYSNGSEKYDKRLNNRRLRRLNNVKLQKGKELLDMKEISDEWAMNKDGLNHMILFPGDKGYKKGLRK